MPRTLSGKVLEVPVKRILTGTPPEQAASRDSLANPAALDYFVELADELGRRGAASALRSAPDVSSARRDRSPARPEAERKASTTSWSNWLPALRLKLGQGALGRERPPVRPVRGHRAVGVGDRDDLALERDLVAAQAAGVAAAVRSLVVGQDPLDHPSELRRADDPRADLGVALGARSARRRSAGPAFRGSRLDYPDLPDVA